MSEYWLSYLLLFQQRFLHSEFNECKNRFIDQIDHSFGPGAMFCGFDSNSIFFAVSETQYKGWSQSQESGYGVWSTTICFFALNPKCFIDSNGEEVVKTANPHVWLKRESIMENNMIIMDDVASIVQKPMGVYPVLLTSWTIILFLPGLLVVSGAITAFHYCAVIDKYGGHAVTVATGESGLANQQL